MPCLAGLPVSVTDVATLASSREPCQQSRLLCLLNISIFCPRIMPSFAFGEVSVCNS